SRRIVVLDKAQRRDAEVELITQARRANDAVEAVLANATAAGGPRGTGDDQKVDAPLDRAQPATHGPARPPASPATGGPVAAYAERMHANGTLGEVEELLVRIGIGEYLAQIQGGIPMSQGEIVRPADLGLAAEAVAARLADPLRAFATCQAGHRARLVEL